MESRLNNDLTNCMEAINNHAQKDNIISMFIKGPPKNKGFMWCSKEGGPGKWWTLGEAEGPRFISTYTLDLGYDSSAYSFFLRNLQNKVKKQYNPE